jgi:hypothetical protein
MSMKFLWTSGPKQRNNAIKFFAMIFTFTTFVVWAGVSLGMKKYGWEVPDITSELLGIFWTGYIVNSRGKEWIGKKKGDDPDVKCCT